MQLSGNGNRVAAVTFDAFVWPRLTLATPFACILLFMKRNLGVRGVYRLVLDGQLLCLAVDQRPNNSGMRGTLPASSCHPVAWCHAQQ